MTDAKPLLIRLSPDQRVRLEAYRKATGARSATDAIRQWLDGPVSPASILHEPDVAEIAQKQRAQPFKGRLKGEWKAP